MRSMTSCPLGTGERDEKVYMSLGGEASGWCGRRMRFVRSRALIIGRTSTAVYVRFLLTSEERLKGLLLAWVFG